MVSWIKVRTVVGQRSGPMNTRAKSSGGTVNVTLLVLTLDHY